MRQNGVSYPGIDRWWSAKVVPGLLTAERVAWVGYEAGSPIASAIVKRGDSAKFCHLRIREDLQDVNLGEVFFSLMALNVRHLAKEIHFTLPESLWFAKSEFFKSFGFETALVSGVQYRSDGAELSCSAPLHLVWTRVLEKLPSLRQKFSVGGYGGGLLICVKPKFAEKIFSGGKRVEVRRAAVAKKWIGQRVAIYASSPESGLMGEATIESIEKRSPQAIWEKHESDLGCTKEEFDRYTLGKSEVSAIRLGEVLGYRVVVPLVQLTRLLGSDLTPPETSCSLSRSKGWAQAVSVANLLHGNFAKSSRVQAI